MTKKNSLQKPHNSYNLFFILERALLTDVGTERGLARPNKEGEQSSTLGKDHLTGYENITVPPLPPRYASIESSLPRNWYAPGRNLVTKRRHVKKEGVLSFTSLSKMIGQKWKAVDDVTKLYVKDVSRILKEQHVQLENLVESDDAGDLSDIIARRKPKKSSKAGHTGGAGFEQLHPTLTSSLARVGQYQDMLGNSAATRRRWQQQQLVTTTNGSDNDLLLQYHDNMNGGSVSNDQLRQFDTRMLHYEIRQRIELLRTLADGNIANNGQKRMFDNYNNYGLPSSGRTAHLCSEPAPAVHFQPQQRSAQHLHQRQQPLNNFVMQMMNHLRQQQPPGHVDQRSNQQHLRQEPLGDYGMQHLHHQRQQLQQQGGKFAHGTSTMVQPAINHLRQEPLVAQCADGTSVAASPSFPRVTYTEADPTEADSDITNFVKLYQKRSRGAAAPVILTGSAKLDSTASPPATASKLDSLLATAELNLPRSSEGSHLPLKKRLRLTYNKTSADNEPFRPPAQLSGLQLSSTRC